MQHVIAHKNTVFYKILAWLLAIISLTILTAQCLVPVSSSDLWWHMTLGRYILATGRLIVDHSIFTWTEASSYHVYNAWLSEVVLHLVYANAGAVGLILLRYLLFIGFFVFAIYFAIKHDVIYNPLVWVITSLGSVLSFVATVIQPESFSFMFMYSIVGLYFTIRTIGERAWKLCYLFPFIIILWVNSHGAFAISALFFTSIIVGELLNVKFKSRYALPTKLRTHLFIALSLCVVALFINPFGYYLPLNLLQSAVTVQTAVANLSTKISGWDPTFSYNDPPYYAIDYLIMAMAIYVFLIWQNLKNRQMDWVTTLAFLIHSSIFVVALRTTYFLAPVFVFASLDLLKYKENSWAWPQTKQAKLTLTVCSMILMGVISYRTLQGAICYADHGSLWAGPNIDSNYAVEEVEYISKLPHVNRIGNTYRNGGYLMYHLWPNKLPMVDSRYFPFIAWMDQVFDFENGYNVQKFVDTYRSDVWLINHEKNELIGWFNSSKLWVPIFIGPAGVVFAPISNSPVLPRISQTIEQTDEIIALINVFYSALTLNNWPLAERIRYQITMLAASRPWCTQYTAFNSDVQIAIGGIQAFNNGDYATAATYFKRKTQFINLTNIAIMTYAMLAQKAWDNNDYVTARAMAIEALSLEPKNVSSVYNAAITDWQYSKSPAAHTVKVNDDITWQFLIDILLKHKEKIPPNQKFILNIFNAMQNGTLHTKPPFLVPLIAPQK